MKLYKVTISGFLSVKDSEQLLIDEKSTILIGANDHGKTNILEAIRCLNDDRPITEDDRNWDLATDAQPRIEWYFKPNQSDLDELNKIQAPENPSEGTEPEQTLTENKDEEVIFYREGVGNPVKVFSIPIKIPVSQEPSVLQLRPRIELFTPPTTNLVDKVTLADLDTPAFEFMQGIFRLAEIWDNKQDLFKQDDKTSKALDDASKKLTSILNDKWNQGKDLEWKFEHTGTEGDHIIIKIKDPSISSQYTRPSLRSSGFRTYFLLSMITYARIQNHKSNTYIYLFDEPGTYLHPYAQFDLQRSFETISDKSQIVYTTHSLFLINKNHPKRNRVISKTKLGTKIDQKPFTKNWKSVRESLGILLSNNFLIAEKTLLVEGASDIIYILQAIKKLKAGNKVDIDLNDLSIVDAGTSENYLAMAKLMLSEGREVVALMDGDKTGKDNAEKLKKICEKELKDKKLQIHLLSDNKSIEDVCVDINLIKEAIKAVANTLIKDEIRKFADGLNIDSDIDKIKSNNSKSLGQIIDETSKPWFNPPEKISKLSISLKYEDLNENQSVSLNVETEKLIKEIKKLLKLHGEKSADSGVFEEVQ
ncbi:MAG: hypothetical protein US62_C0003G0011 [Candidatus Woesebacteria bacterium GW2011_GWA1_37_8]|uniref:AAA domain-containing protein n=2 Tax=Candidatus Woeseibacteriota TaxID=1752722 RepID=A0A0G0PER3_9BACT|nr:MAG: hypothetical protein US39_C0010G0010 [Microgenomates group bacterium GW2011_GWC1_37_12b]KKQ46262.1 MAG: hypothetical protein US62_C0003G0011 [Candidatus Woesebacteria bacterium GW2011_GWA1_37_8]KKQ87776.1 MAG: hypothetical protein UT10_C0001G0017 [Candidatus Woesebacteria bacterium GW2011_GWB1_38_8b]